MTDQSQVETEELRFGPAGRVAAVLALNTFPGASNAYFSFILASTVVVKQGLRAPHQHFFPLICLSGDPKDLHIKMNQKQVFCCSELLLNQIQTLLF